MYALSSSSMRAGMFKKLYFSNSPKKNDTRPQKWESWQHSDVTMLWDQISIKQCKYCNQRCCVCCCTMLLEPISRQCKSLIMTVYSVYMYHLWISPHNHNCSLQEMTRPNNGCATSVPNYNISITQKSVTYMVLILIWPISNVLLVNTVWQMVMRFTQEQHIQKILVTIQNIQKPLTKMLSLWYIQHLKTENLNFKWMKVWVFVQYSSTITWQWAKHCGLTTTAIPTGSVVLKTSLHSQNAAWLFTVHSLTHSQLHKKHIMYPT